MGNAAVLSSVGNTIKYEEFLKLPLGVIASGIMSDSSDGINIDNSGELLYYVVVKYSDQDWAVFCLRWKTVEKDYAENKERLTMDTGIKVRTPQYIKRVFNCSKKILDLYTH